MADESFDTDILEFEGRKFEVKRYYDTDMGPPWKEHDGHGVIRDTYCHGRPEKKPGEVVISSNSGSHWLYDVAATTELARKDGWGLGGDKEAELAKKLGRPPTKGEIIAEAVQRDLEHCKGWLEDRWYWIGVGVRILDKDGEPVGGRYDHAVWGFESEGDYWKEVAGEIANEIMHERRQVWREALKERRAKRYWASRDIITT